MNSPQMQHIEVLDAEAILTRHNLKGPLEADAPAGPVARMLDILTGTTALPGAREDNVLLGGRGSRALFGLARREVPFDQLLAIPLASGPLSAWIPGAACGLAGLLSYDDMEPTVYQDQDWVRDHFKPRLSRCFAIESGLNFDKSRESVSLVSSTGRLVSAKQRLDELLDLARNNIEIIANRDWKSWRSECVPDTSDDDYLERVESIIDAIRDGRFYQLNLLRYFKIPGTPPPGWLERRIDRVGGPWSILVDTGSGEAGGADRVVSFSPEQFVSVNGRTIETYPVKGTIARDKDAVRDAGNAKRLLSSAKDLAELHMIVDLMRNDFNRICELGSVTVPVHQELRSHANVHHLHATVRGILRRGTTLAGLIGAACPAGSITGAPKVEVMKSITRLEGRKRGFHMGHAFHWHADGRFDSSVLIRTLVRTRFPGLDVRYELAAGSGIVVHSDADAEMAEIEVKARVATAPLRQLDPSE